jgi:hypothetical protein
MPARRIVPAGGLRVEVDGVGGQAGLGQLLGDPPAQLVRHRKRFQRREGGFSLSIQYYYDQYLVRLVLDISAGLPSVVPLSAGPPSAVPPSVEKRYMARGWWGKVPAISVLRPIDKNSYIRYYLP